MDDLPKKNSPWTKEEEKLLIKLNRSNMPKKKIAERLGRSSNAIHLRLKILGEI